MLVLTILGAIKVSCEGDICPCIAARRRVLTGIVRCCIGRRTTAQTGTRLVEFCFYNVGSSLAFCSQTLALRPSHHCKQFAANVVTVDRLLGCGLHDFYVDGFRSFKDLRGCIELVGFEGVSAPKTARRSEARSRYAGVGTIFGLLAASVGSALLPAWLVLEVMSVKDSRFLPIPCRHVSRLERLSL